jgi:hypothetical protein
MDGKEPVTLTLSAILRWVVGLSIIGLSIAKNEYFSFFPALFMSLIVVIVLPLFADDIESRLILDYRDRRDLC